MAELKWVRAASELGPGWAIFRARIVDWGVELALMKTAAPLEVLGCPMLPSKVAEEEGGVRAASKCDVV
eukprot:954644-Pyramimonas_sp.AAC.1